MRRFSLLVATIIGIMFALHGTARADCGSSELRSVAPAMRAMEAMPMTASNLLPGSNGSWDQTPFWEGMVGLPRGPQPCSDDPEKYRQVPPRVYALWRDALRFRTSMPLYRFMQAGLVPKAPAVCSQYFLLGERAALIAEWAEIGSSMSEYNHDGAGFPAVPLSTMSKEPNYSHVKALFTQDARELGVTLPAYGSYFLALPVEATKKKQAALDHTPDSANHCQDVVQEAD